MQVENPDKNVAYKQIIKLDTYFVCIIQDFFIQLILFNATTIESTMLDL